MAGGDVVLLVAAGFACGAVNALAGGGSLILFPAMVATGMGTLAANVTNSVATWPGYWGSAYGFRDELGALRHRLPRLALQALDLALQLADNVVETPQILFGAT